MACAAGEDPPRRSSSEGGPSGDAGAVAGDGSGADGAGDSAAGNGEGGGGVPGGGDTVEVPARPEAAPCASDGSCPAGEVCAGDTCAPAGEACADDSGCGADSYCCADGCLGSGDSGGVCIPYGFGPRGDLNAECRGAVTIGGAFSPALQCEWTGPGAGDPEPDSGNVLTTPLVADLPNDSGASAEIVVITYNGDDGTVNPATYPNRYGVLRILSGQDCSLLETIHDPAHRLRASSTPAIADLDGDGDMEIVARRNDQGLVAFTWQDGRYVTFWSSAGQNIRTQQAWDGPSIHDLDGDGFPEVLLRASVYDGRTGAEIFAGGQLRNGQPFNGMIPVVADMDLDGKVELVADLGWQMVLHEWDGGRWMEQGGQGKGWLGGTPSHYALGDFGTASEDDTSFDATTLDGVAEIVSVADDTGQVRVVTLGGQVVMQLGLADRGGPPTVGDFDADGLPEFAIAGKTRFRVFDLDCAGGGGDCEGNYVRWSQPSQDASSAQTGSSVFDFDGDGKAEAVYADECFLRVYEGDTGEVLYSAWRTSGTWYENPVVADVDRDDNTEIVVNSNAMEVVCPNNGSLGQPYVDPLHPGVRCDDDSGCAPGAACLMGFCRCDSDADCGEGSSCAAPLASTPGSAQVCRSTHPNSSPGRAGIRVFRERLDRWASSRPLWNQHAYAVTHIEDDGSVPATADWSQNFTDPSLNNFRQNVQGTVGFEQFPDITGSLLSDEVCQLEGSEIRLTATVCNRGSKAVGADMPATFYQGEAGSTQRLCTSYTSGPVPVGGCLGVFCVVDTEVTGVVTMVVNDDGAGGQTTVECNQDNNTDTVSVSECFIL